MDLGRFDEHRRIAGRRRRHVLLRADREGQFIRIADLAERRSAADAKPRHRGSENEEHRQRARPAQPEMKTADQMRHKPCSGTSNRIRSLRSRCTAAAIRAIVAASCESGRRSPTASRRPQADSAIALGTLHSHREFHAPSTRQDTVLALCGMPLCSKLNFAGATMPGLRLRKRRYRTSTVRTAQRAMNGMNSSPR